MYADKYPIILDKMKSRHQSMCRPNTGALLAIDFWPSQRQIENTVLFASLLRILSEHQLLSREARNASAKCVDRSLQQKVDAQLELLGVSIAAHPLELIADKLNGTDTVSTVDAVARVGRRVTIAGIQQASQTNRTAIGAMLFLSVEDLQGTLDAILFPEVYRQVKTSISSTKPFLLTGIMEMDNERGEPFLRVEKAIPVK